MKWLHALILPVIVHLAFFISLNYNRGILEAATAFAYGLIFFSFYWPLFLPLLVLVPGSIGQILCARALQRANCKGKNYLQFFIGLLNPSIAILTVIAVGLLADSVF